MALIAHDRGVSTLVYDGHTYEAEEHGALEVPEAVARHFTALPGWHLFDLAAHEAANAPSELEVAQARIAELEEQLAKATAPKGRGKATAPAPPAAAGK